MASYDTDTIVVRSPTPCRTDVFLADVQLLRDRGSRLSHQMKGLVIGGVAGALLGWALVGDGCRTSSCDDGELAVIAATFGLGSIGALGGTLIGTVMASGPGWVDVHLPRPVRIEPLRHGARFGIGVAIPLP